MRMTVGMLRQIIRETIDESMHQSYPSKPMSKELKSRGRLDKQFSTLMGDEPRSREDLQAQLDDEEWYAEYEERTGKLPMKKRANFSAAELKAIGMDP